MVSGHAFVGWEAWAGADEWRFPETTMVGTRDFEVACGSCQRRYDQARAYDRSRLTVHRLIDLRARGIWPME